MPKRTLSADMQKLKDLDDMDLPVDLQVVQTTSVLHKKILAAVARAQQVYFIDKVRGRGNIPLVREGSVEAQ